FFSSASRARLPSFPTRRSSDLQRLEQRRAALVAHVLLEAVHAAERDERRAARLVRRHAARLVAARRLLDMEADLLVQLGLRATRSEEHTSELQSREKLVCRLLL